MSFEYILKTQNPKPGSTQMAVIRKKSEADYTFKSGSIDQLRVVRFSGREYISKLFCFRLELASKDSEIDFNAVLGKNTLLTIHAPKGKRYVNGIVSKFEQTGRGERFARYQAEVVPAVWILSLKQKCRIFQEMNIPDIIKKVLTDGDIPTDQFKFSLKGNYQPRGYCVQYRETDLEFISRLMEEEGIFYFFEHEIDKHIMTIGDDPVVHTSIPSPDTVIYHTGTTAGVSEQEHIYDYRYTQEIRPGSVILKDFDFKKPRLNMESTAQVKDDGRLEVYDYPGEYIKPDIGERLAKIRLEELQSTRQIGKGKSDCRRLIPGFRYKLERHHRSDFNKEYTVTRVNHWGAQPQILEEEAEASLNKEPVYENEFSCIPSDTPFRPLRVTQKPIVHGTQTAIVVGPSGEEIYTDEYGRVKVQFHWDRDGKNNEKSSCWIRVSQGWAGTGWGMMFIPRIGQEVMVDFIEGDPDRPIITGRVYNGENPLPYDLPSEKTKSTIKSNTTPGGGSHNELLMEDKSGKTRVVLSNAYGHKITEDEDSQSLTIETRDKNIITLDDKNKNISIKTTNAHSVVMDDTDNKGEGKIRVQTTNGHVIEMDDKGKKMRSQTTNGHIFLLDDENKKVEITTVSGHTTVLDDDKEAIGITSSKGHYITIDDAGDYIVLEDSGGSHRFKIDIGGSTLLISTDSGSINLKAPSGKILLDATDVEIIASNELKMSGGIKGTFDGGVETSVKGVTTKVEGSAITEIKGGLVKIN